ncbi:MAG: glycosyltransferase [Desulfosarcinaceae bacterium]|nr:glycosyltransferase [Desulfosarcinaceae bacterium]
MNGWELFDQIYCISVKERRDRRASARQQFERAGLADRVRYRLVEKDPVDSERGIYESHRACLAEGLAAGAETILIFEDDVLLAPVDTRLAVRLTGALAIEGWEMLCLGALVDGSRGCETPGVRRIHYRALAHAYAVTAATARRLVQLPWAGHTYDGMLRREIQNAYALYPAIAFQSDAPSDNEKHRRLERFRLLCGGLKRIQRVNEFFHRHRPLLLALHTAGWVAMLGIILWWLAS